MDKQEVAEWIFDYSIEPLIRKHGPKGYSDPASYKPWLRDEFTFRCIYCLIREVWRSDGQDSFSVEHLKSRDGSPELTGVYQNLGYACLACNSRKQNLPLPFDPCAEPLGRHITMKPNGELEAATENGKRLIELCRLNRKRLVEFRQRMISLVQVLEMSDDVKAAESLRTLTDLPSDLPNLSVLRPPGGNDNPDGIKQSYFAKKD